MVPQLKENFLHMEGSWECLDEDRGTDRVVGHVNVGLGEEKDVIPETGFEIVFHFGEVKVGTRPALDQLMSIMEKVKSKVKEGARDRTVIDGHTRLVEMPAPRAEMQVRRLHH